MAIMASRGSALIARASRPRNDQKRWNFQAFGPDFDIFAALKGWCPLYMVPRLTTAWGVAKW